LLKHKKENRKKTKNQEKPEKLDKNKKKNQGLLAPYLLMGRGRKLPVG
jgi:hypothetical protein